MLGGIVNLYMLLRLIFLDGILECCSIINCHSVLSRDEAHPQSRSRDYLGGGGVSIISSCLPQREGA